MERVANGIHAVGGYVNSYIIDGDQGVVLVDTGLPKKEGLIENALAAIGRSPTDVLSIVLTHCHVDHMGGAARMKEASNAELLASIGDTPAIQGEASIPPPPMMKGPLKLLTRLLPKPTSAMVDHLISEENPAGLPDDMKAIDTPGHTPGHTSFLLDRDGGVLFVGDAAANRKGVVNPGFPNAGGGGQVTKSIRHLGDFEFDVALFGHAPPIKSGASAAFRAFAS